MELFDIQDFDTAEPDYDDWKVTREFDRLRGLLRFAPETQFEETWYIARCAPDHNVLPLLADHFFRRFGKLSWAIIDEKRNLVFYSRNGEEPVMYRVNPADTEEAGQNNSTGAKPEQNGTADEWKELWKNYHRSVNNEARTNPRLQKQFMPRRYWKYLPEME
jgi:probable DNA metabolism protein